MTGPVGHRPSGHFQQSSVDVTLTSDDERVRSVEECMRQLTGEFAVRRDLEPAEVAILGAVVANLRRAAAAVHPGMESAPV